MLMVTFLPQWYGPDETDPFDNVATRELDPEYFCDRAPPEDLCNLFRRMVPWKPFWSRWRSELKRCLNNYLQEKTGGECQLAFAFDGTWLAQVPLAAAAKRFDTSEEVLWDLREDDEVWFDEFMCEEYELTADHIHEDLVANWSLPDPFGVLKEVAAQGDALLRKAKELYDAGGDAFAVAVLEENAAQAAQATVALRIAALLRDGRD